MRAVVTRVRQASVTIDGHMQGEIQQGFFFFFFLQQDEDEKEEVNGEEKICASHEKQHDERHPNLEFQQL